MGNLFVGGCPSRGKHAANHRITFTARHETSGRMGQRPKIRQNKRKKYIVAPSLTSSGLALRGVMLMSDSVTDSTTGATLLRTGRPARVMYTLCSVGTKSKVRDRPRNVAGVGAEMRWEKRRSPRRISSRSLPAMTRYEGNTGAKATKQATHYEAIPLLPGSHQHYLRGPVTYQGHPPHITRDVKNEPFKRNKKVRPNIPPSRHHTLAPS